MDDMRTVTKELHRIADAGKRIAMALEKMIEEQNYRPTYNLSLNENEVRNNTRNVKRRVMESIKESMESET